MTYYLGCPVWSCPGWRDKIFPRRAPQQEWLSYYSKRFNTVEGNSTFYAIPSTDQANRWADTTEPGFRFALKFPRIITHEKQLVNAETELGLFIEALEILQSGDRLGPTFVQLPPYFSPRQFSSLADFLERLPRQFHFAVEVRHPDFFEEQPESELDDLLREFEIDRVIFDSRALFSKPASDDAEVKSQKRKPQVPIRHQTTGRFPLLRLIGRNKIEEAQPWIDEWAKMVAEWIKQGLTPFVFTHTPDDRYAPDMAERFHQTLGHHLDHLNPLQETVEAKPKQMKLF